MASFDFNSLTLGEVATVEDLSGTAIGSLGAGTPQGKFLAALLMVSKRRNGEPTYTFNQALGVSVLVAQEYLGFGADDDEDTDEGKGEPSGDGVTS